MHRPRPRRRPQRRRESCQDDFETRAPASRTPGCTRRCARTGTARRSRPVSRMRPPVRHAALSAARAGRPATTRSGPSPICGARRPWSASRVAPGCARASSSLRCEGADPPGQGSRRQNPSPTGRMGQGTGRHTPRPSVSCQPRTPQDQRADKSPLERLRRPDRQPYCRGMSTPLPYGPAMTALLEPMRKAFLLLNRTIAAPLIRNGAGPLLSTRTAGSLLVLRTTGRTTGKVREAPLGYALVDGRAVDPRAAPPRATRPAGSPLAPRTTGRTTAKAREAPRGSAVDDGPAVDQRVAQG